MINFSDDDIKKCREFSEKADTSFYIKRNQFSFEKRKFDSYIGKLGELAVYYTLLDKYSDITYPDFKIYKAKEKSWDYDLKQKDFNLHVKTQEQMQSNKFGLSWIFQNEDKHIFLNYNENDYVAFVSINSFKKIGEIKKIISVSSLHKDKLFKKPILDKLINKSAVYYEDIKKYSSNLL